MINCLLALDCLSFQLVLRIWGIYILDGEQWAFPHSYFSSCLSYAGILTFILVVNASPLIGQMRIMLSKLSSEMKVGFSELRHSFNELSDKMNAIYETTVIPAMYVRVEAHDGLIFNTTQGRPCERLLRYDHSLPMYNVFAKLHSYLTSTYGAQRGNIGIIQLLIQKPYNLM
ncbi:unnamed protein product [Didymodactylos carnosus]|uniref:Uncharacterized protein n=1 Tax=Didymodactylos carnosus TaxID=1234261 RepID=A0A815HP72_9BILA|nr:unnamed protein product [Didymodactylos carnosus]CAF1409986.1 unnamed protein product [Didymodactylos carnosus]CAF4214296.1 unnamed protein product [Didymodactylos carnosus]CAF4233053.1 unnamed protein product [Didymodactylos carnosus]